MLLACKREVFMSNLTDKMREIAKGFDAYHSQKYNRVRGRVCCLYV